MNVLHLITSLKVGGAESFLVYLLEQLKNGKDKHVVIYFYDGPNVEKIKELGITLFKVSGLFKLYDPWFYFRLKKIIKKIKPDLIHSSLWSANIVGRLIAKKLKIPIVCDIHNDPKFNGRLRNFLEKKTIRKAQRFIVVSSLVGKSFQDIFLSDAENKIETIINGIDFYGFRRKAFDNPLKRSDFGLGKDDFVIGAIGRLEPIKSFDVLIRAFAGLIKFKSVVVNLCIVGDGSQKEKLTQLSEDLKIGDKVIFIGQRSDAYKFYPLFDCFAMSSKTEGMSIALLEALCFGLPVVTTHQGKIHEVLVDGQNGFLIPPENIALFAQKLNQLYEDPKFVDRIREANINLVKTKFDIKDSALKYKKIYRKIAKHCQ